MAGGISVPRPGMDVPLAVKGMQGVLTTRLPGKSRSLDSSAAGPGEHTQGQTFHSVLPKCVRGFHWARPLMDVGGVQNRQESVLE